MTPDEYLIWAQAHRILGQQRQALDTLEEGLEQHPENKSLTREIFDACLQQASLLAEQRSAPEEQLRLLQRAQQLDPSAQEPLIYLSRLAQHQNGVRTSAQALVDELIHSENPPPAIFAILGTQAAEAADYPVAVAYLRQACQADPQDAQSMNNLAWVLLQADTSSPGESSLDEALQLATRAVQIQPDMAIYRETRGQILVRLGRAEEAVPELQRALNGTGDAAVIHAALADAYERLGEGDLAQFHRRRSR